ncbi:MAG TPA: hypothetical protein VF613_16825, partial [Longimicrobium sp.]
MSGLAWIAAGAVAGIVAVVLIRGLFSARRPRHAAHGRSPLPLGWSPDETGDAGCVHLHHKDLSLIRGDIRRVGDLIERLLEEVMESQRTRVSPLPRVGEPVSGGFREPVRDTP